MPSPRSRKAPTREDYSFSRLLPFALQVWPSFELADHLKRIAQALVAVERGETLRLVITLPPRHGKSLLASQLFPAWYLGRNPKRQIIAATYAQDLADDFGRQVRNLMRDPLYTKIFPGVSLREDSTSAKRFHTSQGGIYVAAGVGGPLTGRGADCLLIDDPIKGREDADSDIQRRRMKDWYTSVAYTRLMPGASVVVIQTRWHEDDLAGWLLRDHAAENWTVLSLPALDDEGQALWPERYPADRLEVIKQTLGSRDWSALYQQRPAPAEGGMVRLDWFQRYETAPAEPLRIIQSWDTAMKAGELNDPSCCTTWAETRTGWFLLDVLVRRMEYPDLRRTAINLAEKWRPCAILVEDKASGQSLLQELKLTTRLPVIPVEPLQDKVTRMAAVTPLMESGRVHLPERAPWLPDFEAEMASFPLAVHDDQADSVSQALAWLRDRSAGPPVLATTGQARVGFGLRDFVMR